MVKKREKEITIKFLIYAFLLFIKSSLAKAIVEDYLMNSKHITPENSSEILPHLLYG